jgi:hypothetical protein
MRCHVLTYVGRPDCERIYVQGCCSPTYLWTIRRNYSWHLVIMSRPTKVQVTLWRSIVGVHSAEPASNSTGSWVLWKIDTRSRVRRSNVVKLVTTDAIISVMNAIAEEDGMQARNPLQRSVEELVG